MQKDEFAWFTLCFAAMSTISVLADSGLGSAFNSLGGRILGNASQFAQLAFIIRNKRLSYLSFAAIIIAPVTLALLVRNGQSPVAAIASLSLVIISGIVATDCVVYASALKLRREVPALISTDLISTGSRLACILVAIPFGINCAVAVFCTLAAQFVRLSVFRKRMPEFQEPVRKTPADWQSHINSVVKSSLPLVIFSCVQGQIAALILATFANQAQVADLGALSRFGILFSLISIPFAHFAYPAISRAGQADQLRHLILTTVLGIAALCSAITVSCIVFSEYFLWILGPNYDQLSSEFTAFVIVGLLGTLSNSLWSIALARGWARQGWLQIPLSVLFMLIGIEFLNPTSTVSAILYSALPSLAAACVAGFVLVRELRNVATLDIAA